MNRAGDMQYKILAVDDDENILKLIKVIFENENMSVITAPDGKTCIEKSERSKPDVIILDLDLPDMSGHDVCRILKANKNLKHIPIVILTGAEKESQSLVICLEEGACDYVRKPFKHNELVARVKNCIRWVEFRGEKKEILKVSGLEINVNEREVKIKNRLIPLTLTEFDLLFNLVRNRGKTVPYNRLFENVWGNDSYSADCHTIETTIYRLRRKLGSPYSEKIINVSSAGYKFEDKD